MIILRRKITLPIGSFIDINFLGLDSQTLRNHNEPTVIHPKWVFTPPIQESVEVQFIAVIIHRLQKNCAGIEHDSSKHGKAAKKDVYIFIEVSAFICNHRAHRSAEIIQTVLITAYNRTKG